VEQPLLSHILLLGRLGIVSSVGWFGIKLGVVWMKANIEKDPETGDLMLVFPEDFLEQLKELKWEIGDTVEWIDNQDGTWSIKKVE
jgi:hypothetical protein